MLGATSHLEAPQLEVCGCCTGVRHHGAAEQRTSPGAAATTRHHIRSTKWDRDPYSARRGLWFLAIAGCCASTRAASPISTSRTQARSDAGRSSTATTCRFAAGGQHRHRRGSGISCSRRVGHADLAARAGLVVEPSTYLFINCARPHVGQPDVTEDNSARDKPGARGITYGEGYHNFHHISRRLSQRRAGWQVGSTSG